MSELTKSIDRMTKRYEDNAETISKTVEVLRTMAKEEAIRNPETYDERDTELLYKSGEISMISYLESFEWDVQAAFESMKNHSIWRKEVGLFDLRIEDIPKEFLMIGTFTPFGKDIFGHPVLYIRMSRFAIPKEGHQIFIRYFLWAAERMKSQVVENEKKFAMIFDCRSPQASLGLLKETLSLYTTQYPLSVAYIAFVEMNFSFKIFYQVIKYFFPKNLRDQMFLLSHEELANVVDESELPVYLGGSASEIPEKILNQCLNLQNYVEENQLSTNLVKKMESFLKKFSIPIL